MITLEESQSIKDKNVEMLVDQVDRYKNSYSNVIDQTKIRAKLNGMNKELARKKISASQWFYCSGYADALKFVLSNNVDSDISLQRETQYGTEHRLLRSKK